MGWRVPARAPPLESSRAARRLRVRRFPGGHPSPPQPPPRPRPRPHPAPRPRQRDAPPTPPHRAPAPAPVSAQVTAQARRALDASAEFAKLRQTNSAEALASLFDGGQKYGARLPGETAKDRLAFVLDYTASGMTRFRVDFTDQ